MAEAKIGRLYSQISEIKDEMTKQVMFLKSDNILQHTYNGMYLVSWEGVLHVLYNIQGINRLTYLVLIPYSCQN